MKRNEGACLICGEDLEYLQSDIEMICIRCGRSVKNNARCTNGHYVCDECHSHLGIEMIRELCSSSRSKNPVEILLKAMENPVIHMHGPEHHVLVGAALLTAYKNAGGSLPDGETFEAALAKLESRGKAVPGGVCGMWGCCGAGISAGIFISVITGTTPLSEESWSLSNLMTSQCLAAIGREGGPRCCKRDSFLSITTAVEFLDTHMNIELELPKKILCEFYGENKQCRGMRCPFHPALKTQHK